MVLSTTKRTASVRSIMNRNQGGGNKKAGFPHMIGRDSWTSLFLHSVDPINGRCCNLGKVNTTTMSMRNIIRPLGSDARIPMR